MQQAIELISKLITIPSEQVALLVSLAALGVAGLSVYGAIVAIKAITNRK